jgi:hypothetical protein
MEGEQVPVYVQWKWNENTKSFRVVFYFVDDFSKPNLRLKRKHLIRLRNEEPAFEYLENPIGEFAKEIPLASLMTWAPTHVELALLSQLLSYANLINGLKIDKKEKLKTKLILLKGRQPDTVLAFKEMHDDDRVLSRGFLIGESTTGTTALCPALCTEYLDFVWDSLKVYLN